MNDTIEEVIHHPLFVPAVVGVVGFASGLGLGFFLGKRKQDVFTQIEVHEVEVVELDAEEPEMQVQTPVPPTPVVIDEKIAKEKGIIKVDSLADLSSVLETLPDESLDDVEISVDVEVTEEVVEEVIETEEDVPEAEDGIPWDWDAELDSRKETEPYILHLEEWVANELALSQHSLTFYGLDEILVDSDNVPVFNHSGVVGELKFGHGSGQEDVVYVRNHELKTEYEITRLDQSFAMEIHGLEVENNERIKDLRHGKVLKFRDN